MSSGSRKPDVSEERLIIEFYQALEAYVARFRSKNTAARLIGISSATLTRASPGWINENSVKGRPARPQARTLQSMLDVDDDRLRTAALALLATRPSVSTAHAATDFDYQSASLHFAAVGQRSLYNAVSNATTTAEDIEFTAALDLLTSFTNAHYCLAFAAAAEAGMVPKHPFGLVPERPEQPFQLRSVPNAIFESDATIERVRAVLSRVDLYDPTGTLYAGCRIVSFTVPSRALLGLVEFELQPAAEPPTPFVIHSMQSQALEQDLVALSAARTLIASAEGSAKLRDRRLFVLARAIEKACLDHLPFSGRAFLQSFRSLFAEIELPIAMGKLMNTFTVGHCSRPGVGRHYFINWLNHVGEMMRIEGLEEPGGGQAWPDDGGS